MRQFKVHRFYSMVLEAFIFTFTCAINSTFMGHTANMCDGRTVPAFDLEGHLQE